MRAGVPGLARTRSGMAGFLAGLLLSSALPSVPMTWAGEYPTSALALSLGMAPELVDETCLLFRLPQRAGLSPSQLFALDNNTYGTSILNGFPTSTAASFGVVGQTGGQGFFLFAQPTTFLGNRSVFQAGWGGAGSVWRVGAAVRGGRDESEWITIQEYASSSTYRSETWSHRAIWEGSVGIGAGREGASFDVVVDARWPQEEAESSTWSSDPPESSRTRFESRDDLFYEVAGRLRFPWGSSAELVASGSWGRMDQELESTVPVSPDSSLQRVGGRRLERWSAGLALSFATPSLDWLALSLYWRHEEIPASASRGFSTANMEQLVFAVSLRERLWRELHGRAGINLRYEEAGSESIEIDHPSELRWQRQEEHFRAGFSWGLSYGWRRFDARVALQETLHLGNLFLSLDVLVRL